MKVKATSKTLHKLIDQLIVQDEETDKLLQNIQKDLDVLYKLTLIPLVFLFVLISIQVIYNIDKII